MALPSLVFAQGAQNTIDSTTNTSTVVPTSVSDVPTPTTTASPADKAATRADRLQQYKDKLQDKLTVAQERRIQGACKAAQTITTKLAANIERVRANRKSAYDNVNSKLKEVVAKIRATDVDTTELDAAIVTLKSKMDAFMGAVDTYQTTVSDLSEMDCQADPSAFKAALESAKSQRVALVSSSQDIRLYVNNTIKPILKTIKDTLQANRDKTDQAGGTQ